MAGEPPSASLATELRRYDRDRYQLALLAPPERRDTIFALYTFNLEVARIREKVREPIIGLMRLQWWRDALDEIYAGAPSRQHFVLKPLAAAIHRHRLSHAHFTAVLDARAQDLEETPPSSLDALEAYAEATSSSLVLLALEALDAADPAAQAAGRRVGVAFALAGLLAAVPFHARQRRVWLPQDLIASHRLDIDFSLYAQKPSPALGAIARAIAERAGQRLAEARAERAAVSRVALPALLPAVIAERRLKRLSRLDFNVMDPRLAAEDTLQSARLAWAAFRSRY